MNDTTKKPASKVTLYPITATIWRNEGREGDTYYSTTFERRYRDKDGTWKGSGAFTGDELLLLAKVADLAHSEVVNLKQADRKTRTEGEEAA